MEPRRHSRRTGKRRATEGLHVAVPARATPTARGRHFRSRTDAATTFFTATCRLPVTKPVELHRTLVQLYRYIHHNSNSPRALCRRLIPLVPMSALPPNHLSSSKLTRRSHLQCRTSTPGPTDRAAWSLFNYKTSHPELFGCSLCAGTGAAWTGAAWAGAACPADLVGSREGAAFAPASSSAIRFLA